METQTPDRTDVRGFYKHHWPDFPLEMQGVITHLKALFPEGVEGKRVLDGGSGSGVVSAGFAMLGADATGVDITPECVAAGEKLNSGARYIQADLTTLDLGDERFDIIYTWGVLHHSASAEQSFHALAKHLKPGGQMVCAVYLKTALSGFWNFSRVFYQNAPSFAQAAFRKTGAVFLDGVDVFKKVVFGRSRSMLRGTSNEEILNDWFGVPHRTFHTYDEVIGWFRDAGLEGELTEKSTGRFKSTSNFVVRGHRPLDSASKGQGS